MSLIPMDFDDTKALTYTTAATATGNQTFGAQLTSLASTWSTLNTDQKANSIICVGDRVYNRFNQAGQEFVALYFYDGSKPYARVLNIQNKTASQGEFGSNMASITNTNNAYDMDLKILTVV